MCGPSAAFATCALRRSSGLCCPELTLRHPPGSVSFPGTALDQGSSDPQTSGRCLPAGSVLRCTGPSAAKSDAGSPFRFRHRARPPRIAIGLLVTPCIAEPRSRVQALAPPRFQPLKTGFSPGLQATGTRQFGAEPSAVLLSRYPRSLRPALGCRTAACALRPSLQPPGHQRLSASSASLKISVSFPGTAGYRRGL